METKINFTAFLLFFSLLANTSLFAQQKMWLDSLYEGGEKGFMRDMGSNMTNPSPSTMGTALVLFSISGRGELTRIELLNSLGMRIDQEIIRAFEVNAKNWKDLHSDATQSFIFPFRFKQREADFFVDPYPDYFFKEMIIVSYLKSPQMTDAYLVEKANQNIISKKYKKAIPFLDELVKRNPTNVQVREARISCSNNLGLKKEACFDIKFLELVMQHKTGFVCD